MDFNRVKYAIQEAIDEMGWTEGVDGDYYDKDGSRVSARDFSDACLISYLVNAGQNMAAKGEENHP